MADVFFKIRHKPTGLFYKPSKHRSKVNLSSKGRVYFSRPSLKWVENGYRHPLPKSAHSDKGYEHRSYIPEDWEVAKFVVSEEPLK